MTLPSLSGVVCLTLTVLHNNIVGRVVEGNNIAVTSSGWSLARCGHDQGPVLSCLQGRHMSRSYHWSVAVDGSFTISSSQPWQCNATKLHWFISLIFTFSYMTVDHVTVSVNLFSIMWSKAKCFCVLFGSVDGEYVRGLFCKSDMH